MSDSALAASQLAAGPGNRVKVWDPATRLFHWSLVALIGSAFVTRNFINEATLYWHRVNGYAILILLVFRLLWGFVGSSTSRFTSFFPTPSSTLRYARALIKGRPLHYLGHNPLGSILIFVVLLMVSAQAIAGLFTSDDSFAQGPMVDHVSDKMVSRFSAFHAVGLWIIGGLVAIHITANLIYQFGFKDHLIDAMVVGTKPAAPYEDAQQARFASTTRAAICLVVSAAIVLGALKLMGQNLLK